MIDIENDLVNAIASEGAKKVIEARMELKESLTTENLLLLELVKAARDERAEIAEINSAERLVDKKVFVGIIAFLITVILFLSTMLYLAGNQDVNVGLDWNDNEHIETGDIGTGNNN